jgi:hypothetical protein
MTWEVLGVVPVLYPSRWSWSFHLFLGRPMLLFPLAYISVPVWVSCLCPFSVHVVATFVGTVLFPEPCSALPVSPSRKCTKVYNINQVKYGLLIQLSIGVINAPFIKRQYFIKYTRVFSWSVRSSATIKGTTIRNPQSWISGLLSYT